MNLPIGMVILLVVAVLIYFGLAHRVLDRMYLTDRGALIFIVLMIAASFFNITIIRTPPQLLVNIGGALFPLGLVIYLLWRADTTVEKVRGVLSAVITAAIVWVAARLLPSEPTQNTVIDPTYLFAIVGGLVAYIAGRSRRSAFIAGSLGIILADVAHYVEITVRGIPGRTWLGGAGAFDSVIIAGVLGTFLAEIIGETREAIQGGPRDKKRRPIKNVEFTGMLSEAEEDDLADADQRDLTGQGPEFRAGPVGGVESTWPQGLEREPAERGGTDELKDIDDYIDEYAGPEGLDSVYTSGGPGQPARRKVWPEEAWRAREEQDLIRRAEEEGDRRG
ncbi:MAG TPA: DUF1614 domain-containing protein [Bacillota bacterium]|jgi:uncharacterized membrane protein